MTDSMIQAPCWMVTLLPCAVDPGGFPGKLLFWVKPWRKNSKVLWSQKFPSGQCHQVPALPRECDRRWAEHLLCDSTQSWPSKSFQIWTRGSFLLRNDFPKLINLILVQNKQKGTCCFAVWVLQQTEVLFLGSVLTSTQNLVLFLFYAQTFLASVLLESLHVRVYSHVYTNIQHKWGWEPSRWFFRRFYFHEKLQSTFALSTDSSFSFSLFFIFFYCCLIQETLTKSALPRPECSRDSLMQTELLILLRNSKKLLFVGSCFTQCWPWLRQPQWKGPWCMKSVPLW